MQAINYPVDTFIGNVLNFSGLTINGYPLSFIIWNIVLAVVAVLVARFMLRAFRQKQAWYIKTLLSLLWLALLPNTAYLMTDARHILGYCPIGSYGNVCPHNAWMTLFFFLYAAIGWPAFVWALRPMHHYINERFNTKNRDYGFAFVCIMSFITSAGVLLGLLNRFNSWELLTKPTQIIIAGYSYINELEPFVNWAIVSAILICLYTIGEKIFIKLPEEE